MATDDKSSNPQSQILTSLWNGLSPHLIAKFYPLKRLTDGSGWEQSRDQRKLSDTYTIDDGFEVHAPITDGTSEMSMAWSSPFEGSGAESKAPMITAMLQSGSLAPILNAVGNNQFLAGIASNLGLDLKGGTLTAAEALLKSAGRTGITKLNSTQIFTGNSPVKLSLTLHFRALVNPITEVRDPILQLEEWALPQLLATNSLLAGSLKYGDKQGIMETLLPSLAPQIIGMKYGDSTYEPMVISSISKPFTNPRSEKGVIVSQSIQISLETLTSIDRRDARNIYR